MRSQCIGIATGAPAALPWHWPSIGPPKNSSPPNLAQPPRSARSPPCGGRWPPTETRGRRLSGPSLWVGAVRAGARRPQSVRLCARRSAPRRSSDPAERARERRTTTTERARGAQLPAGRFRGSTAAAPTYEHPPGAETAGAARSARGAAESARPPTSPRALQDGRGRRRLTTWSGSLLSHQPAREARAYTYRPGGAIRRRWRLSAHLPVRETGSQHRGLRPWPPVGTGLVVGGRGAEESSTSRNLNLRGAHVWTVARRAAKRALGDRLGRLSGPPGPR
jgi:hypothetical protein